MNGHLDWVTTLVLTSNDKYIISSSLNKSSDKTIRIWNLLEKRQETVFQGHADWVSTVAVTSDNKYMFLVLQIRQ